MEGESSIKELILKELKLYIRTSDVTRVSK